MANFQQAFEYVMGNEIIGYDPTNEVDGIIQYGINYTNNPNDRGAATKWGCSNAVWNTYFGHEIPPSSVAHMTRYDAMAVCFDLFWRQASLDKLASANVATAMLDTYWGNPSGTVRMAQTIANGLGHNITIDGVIGPQTIAAINAVNANAFIAQLSVLVAARYRQIVVEDPSQQEFLSGWLARAQRLLTLQTADPANVS